MSGSIFTDKAKKPTPKEMTAALGEGVHLWNEFAAHIREEYEPVSDEWKFYKSWHWKLKRKARTICYLFPVDGHFTVALVFGEKAVAKARESKLPKTILKKIEEARPYAEGRGFRLDCKKKSDLDHLKTLVAIKMNTK
ncbi:DUF3788 domain-containing protein [bacterium]|nr:DUF3788 domain-containing protein [bacterium]MBU1983145.1 DUF3788 domain-containing protein [bacterium]